MTIYGTRYQARKNACGDRVVVNVCGGYVVMSRSDYSTWREQRNKWPLPLLGRAAHVITLSHPGQHPPYPGAIADCGNY